MAERYEFEGFVLERSQQRVLRADGSELGLTPRHFAALLLFVENAGVLLEKDALMRALWPGLVVEDNNLSQTVSSLRRALGEEPPGSRFIQTVARKGFRFIAPVRVCDDAEALQRPGLPSAMAPSALPEQRVPPELPAPPVPASEARVPNAPPGPNKIGRRRWLRHAVVGGTVAGIGGAGALGWAWWRSSAPALGPGAERATLAVLPFKPLTADSSDELLEIGMADSLITRLSIVPGLVVRSVGSVRRYAGAEQDPIRAARDLDVDWIVDGSLQRRADHIRVSARLLRAGDGAAAWSDSFDEKFTGVFDVQDLISARVTQALAARLQASAGMAAGLPQAHLGGTRNTDAYQLYLAASLHTQPRRADGLRKSIELFKQALVVDPGFALAHAGLAQAQRETLLSADAPPASVVGPVRQALQRALALAPNLAEALSEQAFSRYYFDFDWAGAEREFRRALAANPNVAMAHHGLAQLLLNQDRPDEGFVHLRLARELDPMSPFLNTVEASYLSAGGRQAEARARLQRAFDIAPDFYLAHRTQAALHRVDQRPDLAIASLRRAVALADGNTRPAALLGMYLARNGQQDEARAILNQMLERDRTGFVPPVSLAVLHAALDETAPALDALEKALAVRDPQLVFLKDDSRWSGLRQEPRFAALMMALRLDRFGPGLSPS
jgi:TolB-like protein/DNA-binding winged helix-turn-helix (wHTH) protein/Tfp pilus assembly protein PilF